MAVEKRKKELFEDVEAMAVAKKTMLRMQQEDLNKLYDAVRLTIHSVQCGTQYSAEELLAIQKVLKHSC